MRTAPPSMRDKSHYGQYAVKRQQYMTGDRHQEETGEVSVISLGGATAPAELIAVDQRLVAMALS